ncbi:MAG: orotate phosphoribosyltransferase [Lachnospiraceae bacterium]|jgi:orotate phosphoribosyltransferase|nr:orotate phosphoribosyltransferase [Lachnospiraceae bacterium]MCI1424556.1 orotate phosphoribosyltransferase [Lachnospiraceae bacterium]MCI1453315.1 orotate phosphoribosyltransferase [Lachnospiraceae bacterium]MDD5847861.1 orotate phosphoribosyltransferase [Bacillota bacterium]
MLEYTKVYSKRHKDVFLKVIPGHFVTPNSHINYYIDMTTMKTRLSEASNAAHALSEAIATSTIVDTIICMDGTEVIGAYLAEDLTKAGVLSMNAHKTIYVASPELAGSQMIFRENTMMMVKNKNVMILVASTTTGRTVARAIESVRYYGGTVSGISAIFSAATRIYGLPVNALFTKTDLPDYQAWKADDCALCKDGVPITAIANGYGYSQL